ncbi:hypothetical protein LEP1GSC188_1315 [Leptospira weilii serovar Topaz str. LT2116]|uniref:Uncharacterized protein n=2 Tax=Leptospira weilii TaxID=28184 RepID=M3FTA4_9LEPT|nr:hypothetical protein LEP1GSC188_1315 [Leptospira weilii serovar Topaz str. LT2116]
MKTVLESKKSILQKYSGSQKLSQIGKSRLFSYRFPEIAPEPYEPVK